MTTPTLLVSRVRMLPNGGDEDPAGAMSGFMIIFFVIFAVAIGVSIFKFSQTRQMALKKGASEAEATAVALSGDVATAATFLKGEAPRSTEERIREVRSLQEQGLITSEQADQRVAEILRGV